MKKDVINILIADDEKDLREMYSAAFSQSGFNVFAAKDGEEVFDWLKKKPGKIKYILLDIVMPGMDGFEVLEKIGKSEYANSLEIFVFSNLANQEDTKMAKQLGARDFFEKSKFTPNQIVKKIKEICADDEVRNNKNNIKKK